MNGHAADTKQAIAVHINSLQDKPVAAYAASHNKDFDSYYSTRVEWFLISDIVSTLMLDCENPQIAPFGVTRPKWYWPEPVKKLLLKIVNAVLISFKVISEVVYGSLPAMRQTSSQHFDDRWLAHIDRSRAAYGMSCLPHRWQKTVDNLGDYFEGCVCERVLFILISSHAPNWNGATVFCNNLRSSSDMILGRAMNLMVQPALGHHLRPTAEGYGSQGMEIVTIHTPQYLHGKQRGKDDSVR
ncbi:hypothetical protein PR048_007108 [Dryococelus australis]|uniref:Uncharacterized protein n=1 Tax=Dryococelus australis TaxID=614101 RepID=A0ABQ9ICP7_9NEOP|nr:hypothetical protein PR048_007108 [Dryococelus australis]